MAGNNSTSINVRIGMQDVGFTQGMSKLERSLKLIQSEFKEASSKLGTFGNSTEQLKLKSDSLTKQFDVQKQKVSALQQALQQSIQAKGADAQATQNLQIRLNNATATMNNMKRELEETNRTLTVQQSRWYQLSQTMATVSTKMKAVGEKMVSAGSTLTSRVTAPIVAVGVASVKLASDMNESMNKVEVAFGKNADEVKKWSDTTLKSFGIAKGTALDMASLFGDMGTSMGLSTEEASKMSTSLVGLAGDLSSFKNININEAETALNGIFSGETESLKRLGVVMTEQNLLQYAVSKGMINNKKDALDLQKATLEQEKAQNALNEAIKKHGKDSIEARDAKLKLAEAEEKANTGVKASLDTLTQAEKVQLRYKYVLDMTKNAEGDFARTGGGTANQMRIFTESLKELGASIGQYILPIITPMIKKVNEMMQSFGKLDEKTKKTILIVAGIAAAIGPIVLIVGKLITAFSAIAGVVSTVSASIASAGGLLALLTNPIGLIIASIAGLIAIFVMLYKKNEDFRKNVNETWTQISSTIGVIIENIKVIISVFVQISKQIWDKYGNDIMKIINVVFKIIANTVNTTLSYINNIIKIFSGILSGDWQKVWEGVKGIASTFLNSIVDSIKNILELIISIFSLKFKAVLDIVKNTFNAIKNVFSSIKIPHISVSVKWGGPGNAIPYPDFDVKWYARGGIFNKPSVIGVGENGREAVMPLENNTGWIDELATKLVDKIGVGNQPVNITLINQIDGKEISKTIFPQINKMTGTEVKLGGRGVGI